MQENWPAVLSIFDKSVHATLPLFLKCHFTPISKIWHLEWTCCIEQWPQQQFLQYGRVIVWGPHGIIKENGTNITILPSQKANDSIVWHDGEMAGSLIQYYLGNNQSHVHKLLWKMLLPAFGNRIYQVKLDKDAKIATWIATWTLQKEELLMACTSHLYGFALADDFLIKYRSGLYFFFFLLILLFQNNG